MPDYVKEKEKKRKINRCKDFKKNSRKRYIKLNTIDRAC